MKEISAGGVVYRIHEGRLQVQLIQDRYGKITLPKGKMEEGETIPETALREIREETGIVGRITAPLEVIKYQYQLPQVGLVNKEVHYFLVEAVGGKLQPQVEEIRGVEWLEPGDAWRKQKKSGYANNDSVLHKALIELGYEVDPA
ncbi:NUDIX hydrolase [Gorillibacterium sp. sgz5001074]|uniref:NUDIX hydrolase n=1 Tax=Gorillibacterium sp. sgz5001074 TaxID=3446695 RepID=UPI003F6796E2